MAQMKVDSNCKCCGKPLKVDSDAIFITKVQLTDEKTGFVSKRFSNKVAEGKLRVVHYGRVNSRFCIHVECLELLISCKERK